MELLGKVAIITGGSRGIGRAIVERLATEGANVVFTYTRASAEVDSLLQRLREMGRKSMALQADANSLEKAKDVVSETEQAFGHIDILVNNAGITRDAPLMLMKEEDWQDVIDVNLTGIFNYTRSVVLKMFRQGSGKIVNVSSFSGVFGAVGQCNYSASKAGIIGFTKSLAREVARYNIQVNAVAPGFVETAMVDQLAERTKREMLKSIPLQRFGKPEEIAGTVYFLVSRDASYITGQVIGINGGLGI